MNELLLRFFRAIDEALVPVAAPGERLDLYHLGRSALILHHGLTIATVDVDIVADRNSELQNKALELFGRDTTAARALGVYLDPVHPQLPPLPHHYRRRAREVPGDWKVVRLWQLDDHDLAVSKLKSFRPQDRQDLRFFCDQGMLDAATLHARLESAFLWTHEKDVDPDRERAFANLQAVAAYINGKRDAL